MNSRSMFVLAALSGLILYGYAATACPGAQ
jgi:hypothetical protein